MVITYNQGKAITGQALGVRLMAKEDPSCLTAQIFGCTLDTDGTSYRYGQRPAVMAIVLAEEDVHRFVEYLDVAICVLACAFALVVEYACGDVIVAVTGLQQSVGEVDVLAVHEKVLIEQSYLVEEGAAYEHECA